ncbi:site-specific integrase [Cyanobium sp. Morenito 9A2]|uniref:tyrosine-type recombinase/integrase n=1 Tax=Cyanobium sp. Morenito 9A2 TaxID=2823718 RepID=UPI0020CC0BB5|nr:site-specific integrase [Cyanobium sp. Morenito 9A2]MCP9851014.1 integrase arm-type DNA-binding domain-containing protein [Cyanobium sp. Morenito 9A2]
MPFTDSDLRSLQPQAKRFRASAGEALFVEVYPSGGRYFVWRHRFPPGKEGKLRDYQIGPYGKGPGQWTLREARQERDRLDVLRRQGEDPRELKAERRQSIQRTGVVTFQKAAEEWIAGNTRKLAATTLKDYKNKLENQILPVFGRRSIKAITRGECLAFKRTIEARGALNQSDKVFMVLRLVFSYAIDQEWVSDPNPARNSRHSHSGHITRNHPSLDWNDVPGFLADLARNKGNGDPIAIASVKVLLLTFMRVGAVVPGEWAEIDWQQRIWTIPAKRMKGRNATRQEHLIPMSQPLVDALERLREQTGDSPYIFQSSRGKGTEHIALETPNHLIKRMGYQGKLVAHGVRSLALTNGQDILKTPFHVIDLQMGHKPPGKVRQAYDKAQYLEERTVFMKRWADLLLEKGLVV